MGEQIWISSQVLGWDGSWESSVSLDDAYRRRPHEIWERARQLVEKGGSEFDLADGVANLKRCLNHRMQRIEEFYQLKKIPGMPQGYLELLERCGLARPFLIKNLMHIRNEMEHRDAPPPDRQRCKELVDVVWYFLKSTDILVQNLIRNSVFQCGEEDENGESPHWFSAKIDYDTHGGIEIYGCFPQSLVHRVSREACVLIEVEQTADAKWGGEQAGLQPNDIWLQGIMPVTEPEYITLMKKIISAY